MDIRYFIMFGLLFSSLQNYGMSRLFPRTTNTFRSTTKNIRSKASDYTQKAAAVKKTIKDQRQDPILTQTREFQEKPLKNIPATLSKWTIFNALTQGALSYYNILAFTAIPLPLSILLGGALMTAPSLMFDASEILKRHWNYVKQKRIQHKDEQSILHALLDRVTIASPSETEPIAIQEKDVPKALVNKALLPGDETILQAALRKGSHIQDPLLKEVFWVNIKNLIYAGADPNPSVSDESHPINILLHSHKPDVETLTLLVNPMIVPADKLKALPQAIDQQIHDFVKAKQQELKNKNDEWSQNQMSMLNSIEKALETRKILLWEQQAILKKHSQGVSPIDL